MESEETAVDYAEADPWWSSASGGKRDEEEDISMDQITIKSSGDHYNTMLDSLFHYYVNEIFCDVKIVCRDRSEINCHKLVLAGLSDMIKEALEDVKDDVAIVLMPDQDSVDLVQCLDAMYKCRKDDSGWINPVLQQVLQDLSANQVSSLLKLKTEPPIKSEDEEPHFESLEEEQIIQPKRKLTKPPGPSNAKIRRVHKPLCATKGVKTEDMRGQVNSLDAMMEKKMGTLFVNVNQCQDNSMPRAPTGSADVCYMMLTGIKVIGDGINSLPLVWSPQTVPIDYQLVQQLKYCGNILKNVFGLSDIELYGQLHVRQLVGAKRHKDLEHQSVHRELSLYDSSKLKAILEEQEMTIVSAKGLQKGSLSKTFNQDEEIAVKIVKEIPIEEIDGVMLITVHSDGQVIGDILNPCIKTTWQRSERDSVGKDLFQLFFKIVLLRSGEKQCNNCPELVNLYHKHAVLKRRHDMARDYLKDESLKGKVDLALSEVCQECGQVFDLTTQEGRSQSTRHKREHSYANFKCDCPVSFNNITEKKRHIFLVHRKGYVKCDLCPYVGTPRSLPKHNEFSHTRFTCEHCGISLSNKYNLAEHTALLHPEKATAESLKKVESGVCKHCGLYFKRIAKHIRDKHEVGGRDTKVATCSECGKTFPKRSIRRHQLSHLSYEQLPFHCSECPRRYVSF